MSKNIGLPGLPGEGKIKTFNPLKIDIKPLEIQKEKGKFKRSGHLTDQILKYSYQKNKKGQLSIFDNLNNTTKKQVNNSKVEVTEIVEGIN